MKIFILISFFFYLNNAYIVLPFYTKINETEYNKDYMKAKFYNDIFVYIKVGSNKQELPVQIRLHAYSFYLTNEVYQDERYNIKKYQSSKSKTYEMIKQIKEYYEKEDFSNATISKDTFYFGKTEIQKLPFVNVQFLIMYKHITQSGVIGLNLKKRYTSSLDEGNFYLELKKKNIFEKNIFSITYTNENEGYFIFGDDLHNTKESSYTEKAHKTYKLETIYDDIDWKIIFDSYSIGDDKKNENKINCILYTELGLIIGNYNFRSLIEKAFFEKEKNICNVKYFNGFGLNEEYLQTTYEYYECDNSLDETKFPTIYFESKKLNLTYELTYKDVWSEYNGKKYFLIVFPEETFGSIHFIFGKPFLKKYDFAFDRGNQIIHAYDINGERYNKIWDTVWFVVKILLIIIFIIVIILAIYVYYIKIKMPRKKRINEIEDDFSYNPSEGKDTKLLRN